MNKTILIFFLTINILAAQDEKATYEAQCNKSNQYACALLGYSIQTSDINGTSEEMINAYERACRLNNAASCSALSKLKLNGDKSIQRDTFKSFEYAKKAYKLALKDKQYKKDFTDSMRLDLASFYLHGVGTKQNKEQAIILYKVGCSEKDSFACVHLGDIFYQRKNKKLALEYYGKGCDYKEEGSCALYSLIKNENK